MMMEKILMQPKQMRFGKVVKFILPTYLTSLFNTLYTIVDGIFVSACVGTNALAAINIVYPIVNILTGIALAFATGGGAFAAISLGAGQKEKAGRQFSVCLVMTLLVSGLAAGGMALCLPQLLTFLGATPLTMADCRVYAMIWLIGVPAVVGKELCTYFIRADGSPGYGFWWRLREELPIFYWIMCWWPSGTWECWELVWPLFWDWFFPAAWGSGISVACGGNCGRYGGRWKSRKEYAAPSTEHRNASVSWPLPSQPWCLTVRPWR